jgi:Tfp pilus assembly protein PilN
MIQVNLIPNDRLRATRRHECRRMWTMIGVAYLSLLLPIGGAVHVLSSGSTREMDAELAQLTSEISEAEESSAILRAELDDTSRLLHANRLVGVRADWGALLALLPKTMGDEIVLRELRLRTAEGHSPRTGRRSGTRSIHDGEALGDRQITLRMGGIGRSQNAVTQFVLRLEGLQLFRQVKLADTRREPLFEDDSVAFRIECVLNTETEDPT